jgi:bacteriorhodopsin
MFSSILTNVSSGLNLSSFLICLGVSLVCGIILAFVYRQSEHPTKSFLITLAMLPAIVQIVILMVNGNLGVGVAVAGSFSLVRFRSLPGKASDILIIFLAMGLGLCTGMGYVWLALVMAVILGCVLLLFSKTNILEPDSAYRNLRITIPEDLDYTTVFDDVFAEYTKSAKVTAVRTINLGTMYQIIYDVMLKDTLQEKKMIDQLRVRNGNLAIICSKTATLEVTM